MYFARNRNSRVWTPRRASKYVVIGRTYSASPMKGGRYCIRLLLTELNGRTSYDSLKKLTDGTACDEFRESAAARGMLTGDRERYLSFYEASSHATPKALSRIFAATISYCSAGAPRDMWGAFSPHMAVGESDDSIPNALLQLDADLRSAGTSPQAFPSIPKIDDAALSLRKREMAHEFPPDLEIQYASAHIPMLKAEQKQSSESITSDIYFGVRSTHFVARRGGSGRAFLYNAILAEIRGKGLGSAAVASSGIAALILPGGRTAHSKFKLPIRESEESTWAVQK